MEEWTPDTPPVRSGESGEGGRVAPEALALLAAGLKTLQLPVYMYLYQQRHPQSAVHAAFVDLARSGSEKPLFPEGLLKGETGAGAGAKTGREAGPSFGTGSNVGGSVGSGGAPGSGGNGEGEGEAAASVALRELYAAYIPRLPHFVLRHMLECREFTPRPGGHCAWCPYQALCRRRV